MPETHGKTYEIFKKTREERGLSLSDVANALHLTITMIEQIEAGEFTHRHLAPVFIRGYIRSYAKYLNLPENIVDEMVSRLSIENPVQAIAEKSKPSHHAPGVKQASAHHSTKILSYLLVVALLIIAASFWHGGDKPEAAPQPAPVTEPTENTLPESEPASEDTNLTEPEETVSQASEQTATEENASLLVPKETTNETSPPAPVIEAPSAPVIETPPAPVVVTPPPLVKKTPAPPKNAPTATAPTAPEVVDAQETP